MNPEEEEWEKMGEKNYKKKQEIESCCFLQKNEINF